MNGSKRRRRRPLYERIREWIEMPRLTRAERNQRLAILAAILAFGLFLLLRPAINMLFPAAPPKAAPVIKRRLP